MRTEKVSLTLEEELLAEACEAVGNHGLSGYVNRALRHQLQHDRLAGLLADLEQENGPTEPDVVEEVRWTSFKRKLYVSLRSRPGARQRMFLRK